MDSPTVPRIFRSGERFLVFDVGHICTLRTRHRLVGTLVGALPSHKRQEAEHGAPLVLLLEEALLAVEEGFAEVVDADHLLRARPDGNRDVYTMPGGEYDGSCKCIQMHCASWLTSELPRLLPQHLRGAENSRIYHAAVFRRLWGLGLYVTSGATYGADYLCYAGDPMCFHAHLLVVLLAPGQRLRPAELVCVARLACSAKKRPVLAFASDNSVRFRSSDAEALLNGAYREETWTHWDFDGEATIN